jgi:ribosomal protein S8
MGSLSKRVFIEVPYTSINFAILGKFYQKGFLSYFLYQAENNTIKSFF